MDWQDVFRFGTYPYAQLPLLVWLLIALALFFDFLNGFHDAANSVATVVSTRVLSPLVAVAWAAFFNFVALFVFPLAVANTMAKYIDRNVIDYQLVAAALLAACAWNLLTWYLALPTSSTHALVGGLLGAALVKTWSLAYLNGQAFLTTVLFIFVSPLLGMLGGLALGVLVAWLFRHATRRGADRVFRWGQLVSAGWFSLNHGGNDAQKTMGIILALLIIAGRDLGLPDAEQLQTPAEVIWACHAAIALGTLLGGWRIVKTMGQRIIHLRPVDGFCAETGAGMAVSLATSLGIPVSTTHTIAGAIVGVGTLKRVTAVRWGVAGTIIWAWILTIPGSALLAAVGWVLLYPLAPAAPPPPPAAGAASRAALVRLGSPDLLDPHHENQVADLVPSRIQHRRQDPVSPDRLQLERELGAEAPADGFDLLPDSARHPPDVTNGRPDRERPRHESKCLAEFAAGRARDADHLRQRGRGGGPASAASTPTDRRSVVVEIGHRHVRRINPIPPGWCAVRVPFPDSSPPPRTENRTGRFSG